MHERYKHALPTILTVISIAGVIGTAISAAAQTPKALKLIDEAGAVTTAEKVKAAAPAYIPTAVVAGETILAIASNQVVNSDIQASLMSSVGLIGNAYSKYRSAIESNHTKQEILQDMYEPDDMPPEEGTLCFDYFSTSHCYCTRPDIGEVERRLNYYYDTYGYVSLQTYYDLMGLPTIYDAEELGWGKRPGKEFGYDRVYLDIEDGEMPDGEKFFVVSFPYEPTPCYW